MDTVDVRILRHFASPLELRADMRYSYAAAARELGLTEDTVRARLGRLAEKGVVRGWYLELHPDLFGRRFVRFDVDIADEHKAAFFEGARDVEGLHLILDFFRGGMALLHYLSPGAEGRTARLLGRLADAEVTPSDTPFPPLHVDPKDMDWELLAALLHDPRSRMDELCATLGRPERTLRRQIDQLGRSNAAMLTVDMDLAKAGGVVWVETMMTTDGRKELLDLLAGRDDVMYMREVEVGVLAVFFTENVPTVDALREELAALHGVREVALRVVRARIMINAWVDAEVRARVAAESEGRGRAG